MSNWIQTYTGKAFYPLAPRIEDLDIVDIAHSLAMQCRYVGHVNRFYSVAEHSVRVSRKVEAIAESINWTEECRIEVMKWALVHDASEAYLGDMSYPLKMEPEMKVYRLAEAHLMRFIAAWLGLDSAEPALVSDVDHDILGTEARQLKAPVRKDWLGGRMPAEWPSCTLGWSPEVAERNFLQRFHRLWGSVSNYTTAKGHR